MQKMQYKFALENDILEDPRTANAYNEFAPITNAVLGIGALKKYDDLRAKFSKIVCTSNDIENGRLRCDCCLS